MKIKPLNDNILVEIEKESEQTKSGIFIANADEKVTEKAKVLAVPENCIDVKVGDTVFYKAYTLSTLECDGKEVHFLKDSDILAIA